MTIRVATPSPSALQKSSNLSDVLDIDVSRANLRVPVLREAKVAATANVATLSGTATIDGVALSAGDRVLLVGQTTGSQNGAWVVQAGAWTRPNDYPTGAVLTSRLCPVSGGSTAVNQGLWQLKSTASITIDSTATTWVNVSGATASPPPANGIWNFIKCRTTGTGGVAQNNGYARVVWNLDSTGNKANPTEGIDLWWGGWIYLRPGEMSGWQGEVDFLRWDNFGLYNASQDWLGFIWFVSDGKFRLQRFNQQNDLQDLVLMSSAASAPSVWEGGWHRVECHTTLHHTDGSAFNELFIDGVSQGSSTTHNLYSMSTSMTFTNASNSASSAVNIVGSVSIVPGLVITGVTGLAAGTTITSVTGTGPYTINLSNSFTGTTGAQTAVLIRPLDRFRVGTVAINSATQSIPVTTFHAAPYYDRQQRGLGSTVTANGRQALFQAADLSEMDGGANNQNGGVAAVLAG